MDKSNKEMSGWVGWAAFAGVLLILQGFFASIVGFVALFQPDILVRIQLAAVEFPHR